MHRRKKNLNEYVATLRYFRLSFERVLLCMVRLGLRHRNLSVKVRKRSCFSAAGDSTGVTYTNVERNAASRCRPGLMPPPR